MHPIQLTIQPGDNGGQATNLFAALGFFIEEGVFSTIVLVEFAPLKDQLCLKEHSGSFAGAAVSLVMAFQV
jgi:hypothetical protein